MQRTVLHRLFRLSAAEWADLLRAQGALIHAQLLVWRRAPGQLLVASGGAARARAGGRDVTAQVRRVALAVERAAEYGLYRPSCLVQSLALHRMLVSRGVHGSLIHLGTRLAGAHFTAHAWVEYDGQVLGDRDSCVKKFDELARMELNHPS